VAFRSFALAQKVGANDHIRYSGSPIPLSFNESNYLHQVVQVDIKTGQPWKPLPLKSPQYDC